MTFDSSAGRAVTPQAGQIGARPSSASSSWATVVSIAWTPAGGPGVVGRRREWTASQRAGPTPAMDDGYKNRWSALLDAQTRDRPRDDELLDLLGAFEDVHNLGVAVEALD